MITKEVNSYLQLCLSGGRSWSHKQLSPCSGHLCSTRYLCISEEAEDSVYQGVCWGGRNSHRCSPLRRLDPSEPAQFSKTLVLYSHGMSTGMPPLGTGLFTHAEMTVASTLFRLTDGFKTQEIATFPFEMSFSANRLC